jgi:hypothetical protein
VADGSASSTPDTQFLRVDLSPPSQTLLDDITVSSDGLTLSGVMSGWMGHIDTLAISVDGAPARSVDIHSDNDTWSYTLPAGQELAAGSHHTANLTLTDFAGNTSYLPSQPLDVTTVVRSLSTDAMADDDMANAQEAANLSINRNAIDAEDGQSGTIKISADSVGHGVEQVDGFTLGVYGETPHTSRIDLSQLLTGYTPTAADGPAHDVAGQATIDAGDSIGDYLKVKTENGNTVISVDRDGAAMAFSEVPVVMLNGVSTDLATLLANHQIVVSHG